MRHTLFAMSAQYPQTMAALQEEFRELSTFENELRERGENTEGVQLAKKLKWAEYLERERVASAGEKQDAAQNRIWNN